MAQVTFRTFKEWGEETFCCQDYRGFFKEYSSDMMFAGMVLFDTERYNVGTLQDFIRMAIAADAKIIRIDFSNLSNADDYDESIPLDYYLINILHDELTKAGYYDMESYEYSFCYGKGELREDTTY